VTVLVDEQSVFEVEVVMRVGLSGCIILHRAQVLIGRSICVGAAQGVGRTACLGNVMSIENGCSYPELTRFESERLMA